METISEMITGAFAFMAFGLFGVLVARKRKHLKMVVRVLEQKDENLVEFLQGLVKSGELQPAQPA
ncbi:MAG: hypothetical protein JSS02_10265 [Planctomycetes bacterium]|nr:hypothetical protein [Planctomycetota bacterium]